jgi:hypothetical protein
MVLTTISHKFPPFQERIFYNLAYVCTVSSCFGSISIMAVTLPAKIVVYILRYSQEVVRLGDSVMNCMR